MKRMVGMRYRKVVYLRRLVPFQALEVEMEVDSSRKLPKKNHTNVVLNNMCGVFNKQLLDARDKPI
ncbi:hypothetical protein OSB04_003567 [Centaurea solstitialis]|uniref:Uncharacterized protein n=1 Tax=Centaurea solstitialis TaxID=347529 RepID=A0AA38U7L9_9ASTR|nr:hypothetical protein OSB04_003567 [Centaurea solstitialis]